MNILFLTLYNIVNISTHGIYEDLLREFVKNNHNVFIVSAAERKYDEKTKLIKMEKCLILRVKTGNIQKAGVIEKGISTMLIEMQFYKAIRKYIFGVKFDLVLYSTPPITFSKVVEYIKNRDGAKSYLLLKDIFPQNAVDLGMMQKNGVKGLIYRYFRNKEKKLYALSDRIGCMSQANVDYIIKHNPEIEPNIVEVCPNSIEVQDYVLTAYEKQVMRLKYDIPIDKIVFVYGGNLGKPQGVPFLIECLKSQEDSFDVFFLIVGDGTEFGKLESYFEEFKPQNMKLMKCLPKDDYDKMIAACDVGMIFLDYKFTIPNFPSRLLSYMQAGLPVLACTDPNTDIGKVIVEGGFGWWCESNDVNGFSELINKVCNNNIKDKIENSLLYLKENYNVMNSYNVIKKGNK